MFLVTIFYKTDIFCTCLLATVASLGDWLVIHSNLHTSKALFDNTTHSLIGGISWLIVSLKLKKKTALFRFYEIIFCAFIASIIDVDHFISARSWKLKDATNIQGRPFLHCSTVPIVIIILLLLWAKLAISENIYHVAWIIFVAFASHHIRDATRRGLWFYSFGSTPPLPYYMYILLTMLIPHITSYLMELFYVNISKSNSEFQLLVQDV